MNIRPPHISPTILAIVVSLIVITGLFGWTGYNYFIAEPAAPVETFRPQIYYDEQYDAIVEELEEFEAYQIDMSDEQPSGTDNPFDRVE